MKLRYLKEFDGIRAIAALMVMVFHFLQHREFPAQSFMAGIKHATIFGQTGVTLFFVLSGFLITRILLNAKGEENYYKVFYIRRALRIFPLYYFFLVIYYFVYPAISGSQIADASKQWYFWVYLQNVAITFKWPSSGPLHYWSLAVEEHFYLLWPFIVLNFSARSLKRVVLLIIVLALALRVIIFFAGYEVFYFTFTTMDALALGAYLAIQELESLKENIAWPKAKYWVLFLISSVSLLITWAVFSGEAILWVQAIKLLLVALVYYALLGIIIGIKGNSLPKKILSSAPFQFTGKISYGLYVYHPLVFLIFYRYLNFGNLFIDFIASFFAAFLISYLSYQFVESKFLSLKKYFKYANKSEEAIDLAHKVPSIVRE